MGIGCHDGLAGCAGKEFDVRSLKPISENLYSKVDTDNTALGLLAENDFGYTKGSLGLYGSLEKTPVGGFLTHIAGISIDACAALCTDNTTAVSTARYNEDKRLAIETYNGYSTGQILEGSPLFSCLAAFCKLTAG